jgi:hypothetical protein
MKYAPFANMITNNNILYIGDEPKDCLEIIEKFNTRLREIEQQHLTWCSDNKDQYATQYRLQRQIQYHFEGGIAVFKFKNEDEVPLVIREECIIACRDLVFEQMISLC